MYLRPKDIIHHVRTAHSGPPQLRKMAPARRSATKKVSVLRAGVTADDMRRKYGVDCDRSATNNPLAGLNKETIEALNL